MGKATTTHSNLARARGIVPYGVSTLSLKMKKHVSVVPVGNRLGFYFNFVFAVF